MIDLQVQNGPETVDYLRGFPDRMNARLIGVMQTIGATMQGRVADKLGGAVLRKRSGQLGGAVDVAVATQDDRVAVTIGVAGVPYAAYQEYGFHGTETVRAHLRMIKEVFGRSIAPRAVSVRSYARRVDYPAHSYLRSALADMTEDAQAQIETAVADETAA